MQVKLRTSENVFSKILWTYGPDEIDTITVGYLDRFRGILEEPFRKFAIKRNFTFDPDGRPYKETDSVNNELFTPFHRVYFFKKNGQIIWDRETKVNKVWD
jgi:uncharacterized protein (UPF0248 family)